MNENGKMKIRKAETHSERDILQDKYMVDGCIDKERERERARI